MSLIEVGTRLRVAPALNIPLGHAWVLWFFWSGQAAWGTQNIAPPRS
jgi:hypothetical protein